MKEIKAHAKTGKLHLRALSQSTRRAHIRPNELE